MKGADMGIGASLTNRLAALFGGTAQGEAQRPAAGDAMRKSRDISIESIMSESLASLLLSGASMMVEGEGERAGRVRVAASDLVSRTAQVAVAQAFVTGDALVVPRMVGERFSNFLVGAEQFAILAANGDELTDVVYIADKVTSGTQVYRLVQRMKYADGMVLMQAKVLGQDGGELPLSRFARWDGVEAEQTIEGASGLPIGRLRSFAVDHAKPNSKYGAPICIGASAPIREAHYLMDQQHEEFVLSEKGVIADKTMLSTKMRNRDGSMSTEVTLPRGKERLWTPVNGNPASVDASSLMQVYAPSIQQAPYAEALEQQFQLIERAVGVDAGILSRANDMNYMNVDNVRKSMLKTQAFIQQARHMFETCAGELAAAWDMWLDIEGVPSGEWSWAMDWSDDYINTFADQRESILAGIGVGAMDAADYRAFVMGEPEQVARERVSEIADTNSVQLNPLA